MNFTMRKIGLIAFCFIFIIVGSVLIGTAISSVKVLNFSGSSLDIFNLIPVAVGLFFIIIASTICIFSIMRLNQIEK